MNKEKLKELIEFAQATDLQEVVWEKKGVSVRFRVAAAAASAPAHEETSAPSSASDGVAPAPEKLVIRSTMVGTFYRGDAKDRPPLVVEGTLVTAGQPVGSVEAMKIMKDAVSPLDCKIVRALVENGHAVEYGQALFEIESAAGSDHV